MDRHSVCSPTSSSTTDIEGWVSESPQSNRRLIILRRELSIGFHFTSTTLTAFLGALTLSLCPIRSDGWSGAHLRCRPVNRRNEASSIVYGLVASGLRHEPVVRSTSTRFVTESAGLAFSRGAVPPSGSYLWRFGTYCRSFTLNPRSPIVRRLQIIFQNSCGCHGKPKENDVRQLHSATLTRQPTRVPCYLANEQT